MKIQVYFIIFFTALFTPLLAQSDYENEIKKEWLEYIESSLQKKNKFNLSVDKILDSVESQIISKYGSFENFDKGFKKGSPKYLIGFLKILYKAEKKLLEEKWEEKFKYE